LPITLVPRQDGGCENTRFGKNNLEM